MFHISIFFEKFYDEFAEHYRPWLRWNRNGFQIYKNWVDTDFYYSPKFWWCQEWPWEIFTFEKYPKTWQSWADIKNRGWILGRNPDKRLPPCYSLSPLQLWLEGSISSNSRNFLCVSSNSQNLLCISTVQLLYTLKEKGGKHERNHTPVGKCARKPLAALW